MAVKILNRKNVRSRALYASLLISSFALYYCYCGIRTYNDKAYTFPKFFGQFVNFRIFIKFSIHWVKKTSKF